MSRKQPPTVPENTPRRSEVRRWTLPPIERVRHRQPGQEWVPHWHDEWSLGAIVQGECLCSVGGSPMRAVSGDILAIAPQTVHTGALTPAGSSAHVSVVMFYVAPEWFDAQGLVPPPGSGFLHRPALAGAAEGMTTADEVEAWIVHALPEFATGWAPPARSRAPSPTARTILSAVREGLAGGESVAALAGRCGISRERLHRVIRRWTGMSPSAYLRMLRLHTARERLFDGESPASAAAACGFADQAHFTRLFRQAFGYTPGDLRSGAADGIQPLQRSIIASERE